MKQFDAPVITIDGASGTGKGTVSQLLAEELHWNFLDSGALYRVLALAAAKRGIDLHHEQALLMLAEHLDVQFATQVDFLPTIILEGEDVTDAIRNEKVGNNASTIAVLPGVRAALLSRQRAFREAPGLVADGRDMGTVVFPDAALKIFLTASKEERVLRRFHQLKAKGINVTLSDLERELHERDKRDQERLIAPLKPAADAIEIHTDQMTVSEVVERILEEMRQKKTFPVNSMSLVDYDVLELAE